MKILKGIGWVLLCIVGIAAVVAVSAIGGYILRWLVYLVCFINSILGDETALTLWIHNHPTGTHIICSLLVPVLFVLMFLESAASDGGSENSSRESYSSSSKKGGYNLEEDIRDTRRRQFSFVDCSGAYRRWGDTFVDHKGNYCKWGSGFYDYDDNYIGWGDTYKDSSGAYRRWGDDFVDCAGNHVRNPR